ncbi:MAG: TraR/DksA C4-type zinc finger protein [Ferruginibacter sp.]|nr:TraR/DksA family transcriptional regulator [Chitinophagaceae bacterium]MBP6287532.1 TraR/DksA family transcriptional regulator [Ferruginibacter sp.]MBU9936321.1 TraR/DksA C4-type zinc finger protein [Ferruginibacter sp.]
MATKKHAPAKAGKATAKPAAKKPAKPVKKSAPAKKTAPKKAVAKKPVAKKPVAKKPAAKKPGKAAPKKPVAVKKPVKPIAKAPVKPMKKKIEVKKPAPKAAAAVKKAPEKVSTPLKAKDIKITPAKPVVLPKINTKTSRKYQPDFTRSVLDQPVNDPGAPIVRYSDADLTEFRELIQRKLESAKKELAYLQGLITRKDETGGDMDDSRYMTMEDGSISMEREQLSQMASRQITFIDHLEKALMRIENKTYGICRVTGKLIDKARLRAVPHATLSIEAKMGAVK